MVVFSQVSDSGSPTVPSLSTLRRARPPPSALSVRQPLTPELILQLWFVMPRGGRVGSMSTYETMSFHLETERLMLRPWAESDAAEFCDLLSERGKETPTVEHIRTAIGELLTATETTGIALLPIQRRDEGDFIGYCGLIIGRSTLEEPEIAYELFRRAHGRGYATEAADAVLDAAIATGRNRLWSTVATWNTPSLRVLEKLGFERDHVSTEESGEVVWLTRSLP